MRRSVTLQPLNGLGPALEFEWDPATGALGGRNAGEVRALAADGKTAGYWLGHPHPTPYVISDPLRRPGELAVLLGNIWQLDPELAQAYPEPPIDNEIPPGAIA